MKAVIQRVTHATLRIREEVYSQISYGLVILLGIAYEDTEEDIDYLVRKIIRMRIFDDSQGVMNLDIQQTDGSLLLVSQFTLLADTRKGNRPSYIKAASPEISIPLYEKCIERFREHLGDRVQTGKFGANMQILLENDGPVTILLDSKQR